MLLVSLYSSGSRWPCTCASATGRRAGAMRKVDPLNRRLIRTLHSDERIFASATYLDGRSGSGDHPAAPAPTWSTSTSSWNS